MQIIDVRGKLCPAPLILTKRAIKNASLGTNFDVLCDNETAKNNLLTYLKELGFEPTCNARGGIFTISFTVVEVVKAVEATEFCNTNVERNANGYCVVIKSRLMGNGDEKLGEMLMRAFINSLVESDVQPQNIVLYNEGVKVALWGKDTADTLKKLSDNGVKITVCGTCVDYYNVKGELAVGEISNMYKITEILATSSHVIYP